MELVSYLPRNEGFWGRGRKEEEPLLLGGEKGRGALALGARNGKEVPCFPCFFLGAGRRKEHPCFS